MIILEGINKYYGENHILKNVSLHIKKGQVVSLVGKSGAGKSTLLRCINKLIEPDRGSIIINGKKLNSDNIVNIRKKIGMVFQDCNLFEHLTVKENLLLAPIKLLKEEKNKVEKEAMKFLSVIGLESKLNSMPAELSGGEKQRIAIVRCLMMKPEIILFDEPTSALDPMMKNEVLSIIYDLAQKGMTMLIVTHEIDFARTISDRIIFMDSGEIIEDSIPELIFAKPKDDRTKRFLLCGEMSNIEK